MPAHHAISPDTLARLVALPDAPVILDLRADPAVTIPGARVLGKLTPPAAPPGRSVVVVDEAGGAVAGAAVALLRSDGVRAERLEGGLASWTAAGLPTIALAHLPPRRDDGRTWWVTRARPKVDRIACPWLIRRFIDPDARFLYVSPAEVLAVAARERAEPFDVEGDGVQWTHRGERCSFDALIDGFGLAGHAPLARMAAIVRGADTDRLDLAPEAAGLLALSLGLSRLYDDDHAQLEAGLTLYDALYRWCRDAQGERHDARSHRPARAAVSA